MRTRTLSATVWAFWLVALTIPGLSGGQPVRGRVLEGLSFVQTPGGWRLRIRFGVAVRYLRHSPRDSGERVDVQLAPLLAAPERAGPSGARESLLVPPDAPVPIEDVTYEGGPGGGGILHLTFARPLDFRVSPGGDLRSVTVDFRAPARGPSAERSPLPAAQQARSDDLLGEARRALTAGELDRAIAILTKALALPENPNTPAALELLGIARERNGQLAHANAVYEDYLARYPGEEGAARVRQRRDALLTARAQPVARIREPARESRLWDWRTFGSLYTSYRRASVFTEELGETLGDSSLLNDVFLSSRLRTDNYSVRSDFSGSYRHDFRSGEADEIRVGTLFAETRNHAYGYSASIGRRLWSTAGVLGRYDGVRLAQKFREQWELSVVAGSPVESTSSMVYESGKLLGGFALDVTQISESLDAQIYAISQLADGSLDRAAVGAEFRYFRDGRFASGILDYDVYFQSLNIAQLTANWRVAPSLFLNALADYRNVPSLSLSNAIQGQAADHVSDLEDLFSNAEIKSLAEDRTAKLLTLSLGATYDVADDLQLAFDFNASDLDGTPSSGGVEGLPGSGFEFAYLGQVIADDLLVGRDVGILALRYFDGSEFDVATLGLDYRLPIVGSLRANPRLRADYRPDGDTADVVSLRPSLRLDYRIFSYLLDVEAGVNWRAPLSGRGLADDWDYYLTAGIRFDF